MNEPNFYLKTMWQGVLAVVLCACFAIPAQAQTPVVTLDARNVTIKELLQRIEAASPYTFAYVNAEIDTPPHRKVTVNAENRSIESILAEVLHRQAERDAEGRSRRRPHGEGPRDR